MLRKLLGLSLFVIGAVLIPAQVQYAKKITQIHAGVLLINSWQIYDAANLYSYPGNGDPYVWYNLDASRTVRPADWTFVNPHGSTVITNEINRRWSALQANAGGNVADVPLGDSGAVLSKNSAPYWEVALDSMSDSDLADYNILSMSIKGPLALTPGEREKLTGYVDEGGVLWVDISSQTVLDSINGASISVDPGPAPGLVGIKSSSPILDRFDEVTTRTIVKGLTDASSFVPVNLSADGAGGITNILETTEPSFTRLETIAGDTTGNAVLAVAKIGDGFLVISAGGMGDSLNRGKGVAGPSNNQFYAAKPALDDQSNSVGAIVTNAIGLGGSYTESFGGSRKTNSSSVDLHAPLLRQFYAPLPLSPGNRNFVPPATFKNYFFVSTNDRIYAYDGTPGRDINGDGNVDDGTPDSDISSGLDLLWSSKSMPGPISSPTCVSIGAANWDASKSYNLGDLVKRNGALYQSAISSNLGNDPGPPDNPAWIHWIGEQVMVVDAAGTVHVFDAGGTDHLFPTPPHDPLNVQEWYTVAPPSGPADFDLTEDGRGPFAPTIHDGLAYIADTQTGVTSRVGRMWVMNPATGAQVQTGGVNPWTLGGSSSTGMPEISGPPTVGLIPVQDNSGGQDIVAYLPTRPDPTAIGSPTQTAGLVSMWVGVKGEKPQNVQVIGSNLEVTTRANLAGLKVYTGAGSDPLGIKVSVVRISDGMPLDAVTMAGLFNGSVTQGPDGILDLGLGGTWDFNNYSLRIDYYIDWGSGSLTLTDQVKRGFIAFPDAARTRRVLGAVALGANGNLFVSVSDQARGGTVYGLREEGRGLFRMLYRYELYDQHTITLSSASPLTYRETFINEDPITTLLGPEFQGPMTNLTLQGAPAVHNGLVFATATANVGPDSLPATILMALKENPEPVRVPVGNISDSFVLVQPDIARSVNLANPETFSVMTTGQFSYESQGLNGYVVMENLMGNRSGVIQNAMSSSQPVILRQSGVPDKVIEPDAMGGRWSPLVWYTVLNGTSTQAPPIVTGNTVFVGGNSKLPDMLTGATAAAAVDRGVMFAMDADAQPLPPVAYADSVKPWMSQVPFVTTNGSTVLANEVIRWPQGAGVNSFSDWQSRYYQTALRPGDTSFGVAGGDGALFTWGPSTLYGFTRGELLIADEGRLLRMDGAGNPLWSSDTSQGTGSDVQSSNTTTIKTLVHPTRAYRVGTSQTVVTDPAGNRVVLFDVSGRELRSITNFKADQNFKPDGYAAGDPMKLSAPADVATYSEYVASTNNKLTNPQALEYWVHYIIADSGNRRVIELVDRYAADPTTNEVLDPVVDGTGAKQLGVLYWQTPASYSGKQFHYNSIARVFNGGTFEFAAGIGNATPATSNLGGGATTTSTREAITGNGGIILFNDTAVPTVVNSFTMPAIPANKYYDDATQTFTSSAKPQRVRSIGNVNSVTMRTVNVAGVPTLAIMFTDASGVYEIYQTGATWTCRWALPREMYRAIRRDNTTNVATGQNPRDLLPMYARRLDSGEVIVANCYLGLTRAKTPFTGEVIVLNGDPDTTLNNAIPGFDFGKINFGFNSQSVRLSVSTLTDVRNLIAPVFADLK
jgi:hypothetical protein